MDALKDISYLSIKATVCEWACLFVCLFPNSFETANPSELKFCGMISLGIRKVLGQKTKFCSGEATGKNYFNRLLFWYSILKVIINKFALFTFGKCYLWKNETVISMHWSLFWVPNKSLDILTKSTKKFNSNSILLRKKFSILSALFELFPQIFFNIKFLFSRIFCSAFHNHILY